MNVVWDSRLPVHYGFVHMVPVDAEAPDIDESRRDQTNGLLGAAVPGALSFLTGTHTGEVAVRIEWHEEEPSLDGLWEDVVEASVEIESGQMRLSAFDNSRDVLVPATGPHRARLSASGLDTADDVPTSDDGHSAAADRYLLQLWPARPASDRIVRVGSRRATYWHSALPSAGKGTDEQPDVPLADRDPLGQEDRRITKQALQAIPKDRWDEIPAGVARMACERVGIAGRYPIAEALDALDTRSRLDPAGMTVPSDVMTTLESVTHGPHAPSPERVLAAIEAVFAAARPSARRSPTDLIRLVSIAMDEPSTEVIDQARAAIESSIQGGPT